MILPLPASCLLVAHGMYPPQGDGHPCTGLNSRALPTNVTRDRCTYRISNHLICHFVCLPSRPCKLDQSTLSLWNPLHAPSYPVSFKLVSMCVLDLVRKAWSYELWPSLHFIITRGMIRILYYLSMYRFLRRMQTCSSRIMITNLLFILLISMFQWNAHLIVV